MNNKVAAFIVVLILIGGGVYLYQRKEAQAPEEVNNSSQTEPNPSPTPQSPTPESAASSTLNLDIKANTPSPTPSQGTFSNGEEGMGPDISVVQIDYDGSAFSPSSVNIKVGDIVVFKNNGDVAFWPASAPHPTHTAYPEFDAKQGIAPGGKYQFKFTKAGNWKFHDHLNPTASGAVNATQ